MTIGKYYDLIDEKEGTQRATSGEPVAGEPDAPTLADVLAAKDAENEFLKEALREIIAKEGMLTFYRWHEINAALSEQEGK